MIISSNLFFVSSLSCSSTARTSAAPLSPPAASIWALLREPPLAPMRMTAPVSFAAAMTSARPADPLILPGFILIARQPAFSAARASRWSKWMSAMSGRALFLISSAKEAASRSSGSAALASSQPAAASSSVSAAQPSISVRRVFSMLSTRTGAPPPILRPPIDTLFLLPMTNQLLLYKSVYVFAGDEEDQREQDDEAGVMNHRLHSLRHLTARHQFHEDEDYPASVKRRKRQ